MKIHTSTEPSPIAKEQIAAGVETLKKVIEKTTDENDVMMEEMKYVVTFTVHKISAHKRKSVLIKLPHALYTRQSEICFFTKDIDKKDQEATEYHWQNHFKQFGFSPKTISVQSLKKDYKQFESKLKLAQSYDLFLADERVYRFLPTLLGKHFYQKRKFPLEVQVTGDKFPERLDELLTATKWTNTGHGDSSRVMAGIASHTSEQLVDNIEAILKVVANTVDRGWANVRSVHVKTNDSMSIPIYQNEEIDETINVKCENELKYLAKLKEIEEKREALGLKRKSSVRRPAKKSKKTNKKNNNDGDENEKDVEDMKEEAQASEEEAQASEDEAQKSEDEAQGSEKEASGASEAEEEEGAEKEE